MTSGRPARCSASWPHSPATRGAVGGTLELRLPDVRALMAERLAGQPTRANFRTGTLTVCTMVPMRSVPHRVVCLLGLDDGVFPRAPAVDGDDVLARDPLTGERDLRSEDRQLLLDAMLAARERLVVTYSGFNETTGQRRPPAVPLGELLDALDDTAADGRAHALVEHPLQAFDRAQPPAARAVLLRPRRARGSPGRRRSPGSRSARWPTAELPPQPRRRPRARLPGRLLPAPGARVPARPARRRPARRGRGGRRRTAGRARQPRAVGRGRPAAARPAPRPHHRPGPRHRVAARGAAAGSARLAARAAAHRRRGAGRRDGRVGHPGAGAARGRRRRRPRWRPPAPRHGHRPLRRPGGHRHLLAARAAPVARGLDPAARPVRHPSRPLLVGRGDRPRREGSPRCPRRGGRPGRVRRASTTRPTCCATWWRCTTPACARRCRSRCARPTPGPRGAAPGNDVAVRRDAEFKWLSQRFPGENDDAAHVAVWGTDAPLDVLLGDPRPGEERDGEDTRLGALAMRLWQPMLQRGKR